jgi:hypothetical protein
VQAKFVYEAISDLLAPKSEKEIRAGIEREFADSSPNDLLSIGVARQSLPMIKLGVEKGADSWLENYGEKNSRGQLWRVYNSGDDKDVAQEIILLALKTPILRKEFETNPYFRISVLHKTIYMGFLKVMDYILTSELENFINPFEAAAALDETAHYFPESSWKDAPQAQKMVENWLSSKLKYREVNEALGDVLKPKSKEEVHDVMKDLDLDEWRDMVVDAIHTIMGEYGLDGYIHEQNPEEAFEKRITPPDYARQMIEKHYKEKWKPDGAMTISNTGGIELKLTDGGDGVEYRYTGEIIPHGAMVDYDYGNQEVGREDEDDEEGGAFFEDTHGNKLWLGDFMRV